MEIGMKARSQLILGIALVVLTFIAGYATASIIGSPSGDSEAMDEGSSGYDKDYHDAVEIESMLGAIALEHAASTFSRSPGCQIRMNADRYIDASRKLTDLQVAAHYPDQILRIHRLREATERFAAALPEAAMTHNPVASAYQRETRAMLIPLERLVRQEMVGGDGLLGNFGREVDWSGRSAPINIAKLEGYIRDARYIYWESSADPLSKQKADSKAARDALLATLPHLQAALTEWPPEFSRKYEAHLDEWLKDWFGN